MNILVIGGSKGLGKEIVDKLKYRHGNVVTMSRSGGDYELDLMWPQNKISDTIKTAVREMGGLDVLIISSGRGEYHGSLVSECDINNIFRVNTIGPIITYQAAFRGLFKSKGKAIFITSTSSRKPGDGGLALYGASKAAINSFVISEARRAADGKNRKKNDKDGVAVCSVSPGWFNSPMTKEIDPKLKEKHERYIPMGRYGETKEIAEFIVTLVDQSNWCLSGSIFEISGGA